MRTLALAFTIGLVLLGAAPALAQQNNHASHGAHNAAVQTTPADGEMGAAPASFSANFEHPMRLTALVIVPRGGDPIAVAIPNAPLAQAASVALPRLSPGNYVFAWTAAGADNHTMTGRVRYMVH